MTGADLRSLRKALGLSQVALARQAGVSRDAVQYWERKATVDPRQVGPRRLFAVLGVQYYPTPGTYARAGWGLTEAGGGPVPVHGANPSTSALAPAPRVWPQAGRSIRCGALTRKGQPCRHEPEPGRTRCKFHGGRSTGPRTPEGRARIAEAQRHRWARWRAGERGTSVASSTGPALEDSNPR